MAFKLNDKVKLINLTHQDDITNDMWSDDVRTVGMTGVVSVVYDEGDGSPNWYLLSPPAGGKDFVAHESELLLVLPKKLTYKKRDWVRMINKGMQDDPFLHNLSCIGREVGNVGWIEDIAIEAGWYYVLFTEFKHGYEYVHISEIELYTEIEEFDYSEWGEIKDPQPLTEKDTALTIWLSQ